MRVYILLVLLLISCERKPAILDENLSKLALEARIEQGDLLIDVIKELDSYVFNFESEHIRITSTDIIEVNAELDHWRTKVIFSDASSIYIPTKGEKLDYIVESIQVNPSGFNPLSALVDVWLPTYGRVHVTVFGKNGDGGNISHLCQENGIRSRIPILGLYANYNNKVRLAFTDMKGNERGSTTIYIQTGELGIENFPSWKIITSKPEKMEPGLNLINYPGRSEADLSIPYMLDHEGELRWLLLFHTSPQLKRLSASVGFHRTTRGTFIAGDQSEPRIIEVDMFGNLQQQWDLKALGYGFHHEVTEAGNGNFLVTVTKSSARLQNGEPRINDYIIEYDPRIAAVVKEWDLSNQLDTARYLKPDGITPIEFSQTANNWAHNNAITPMGNNLLASLRYQGLVNFNRSGVTQWIISPHKHWGNNYRSLLLKPVAEDGTLVSDQAVIDGDKQTVGFDWPWGPHAPVVLSEDRILVFDNGYNRNWLPNYGSGVRNYSRIVEYKINMNDKTVQQIWSYGKERGEDSFSQAVSGVQYLQMTGHVLFCPGMGVHTSIGPGGRIIEIDPKSKKIVFELEISSSSSFAFHRAQRLSLYPATY